MRYSRTTMGDIAELMRRVRPSDERELRLSGQSVGFALGFASTESYITISANDEKTGRLFGIAGLVRRPEGEDDDTIWGIGTVEADKNPVLALKTTKEMWDILSRISKAKRFHNAIPAEFDTWRKWLANHFNTTFDGEFATPEGVKFLRFHIVKGEG